MWQINGLDGEFKSFIKKAKLNSREAQKTLDEIIIKIMNISGDIIPGTNGSKKVRFKYKTFGLSSGGRVVYYPCYNENIIYIISIYGKAWKTNLSEHEKNAIKKWIKEGLYHE